MKEKISKIWVCENFKWKLKEEAIKNKMKIIPFTKKLANENIDLMEYFNKSKKNVFPKIN